MLMNGKSSLIPLLSHLVRNPGFGVSHQVQHKLAIQPQKMARGLKFQIKEVDGLFYLCCEKNADQLPAQLICTFVFAYAKCRFSHDVAHLKFSCQNM